MRILYFITKSSEGGAQTHITQLAKALLADGHSVGVMSAPGGWLEKEVVAAGGTFFPNPYFKNSYNPLLLFKNHRVIKDTLRTFKPDIVSCHSGFAGLTARLSIRNRIPTLFTAHGWSFSPGAPILQRILTLPIEWIAARWCATIICVSEYDHKLALRYGVGKKEQLVTVHNGVEIPIDMPAHCTALRNIIFIGRLVNQKRPLDVLKALTLLPKEVRDTLSVSFVGGGALQPSLEKFASEHALTNVTFMGNIHRSNVLEKLSKSDLFVLPTNYEGLPRSILEALAYGVPVLASGVAGIPELIQEGVGCVLTAGKEPEEIAAHIEVLSRDPKQLEEMGVRAYRRAKEHFSLEKLIKETSAIYESILGIRL